MTVKESQQVGGTHLLLNAERGYCHDSEIKRIVKAAAGLGIALSNGVWTNPQRRPNVQLRVSQCF
jgi:hypothetical protein